MPPPLCKITPFLKIVDRLNYLSTQMLFSDSNQIAIMNPGFLIHLKGKIIKELICM
jgi:hypothetical protein